MTFDNLRQDLRHAVRGLLRTPAFTVITILTLALGIGANTAIFSIVNGVILRPLGYPKPEQLMYLTTQFPGMGFLKFWVSPPEYMEFREINQSFSAVGAFTTGEVNLTAGDRPVRVRSASVDEHLLNALGVPAAQGRLFASGETDITGGAPAPGQPPPHSAADRDPLARAVAVGVRRPADRRPDRRSERPQARSDRHHAARHRRDGQPHRDLAAARTQSRPTPEPRQPLPLFDRPAQGRRDAAGRANRAGGSRAELGRARRREEPRLRAAAEDRRRAEEDRRRPHSADGADARRDHRRGEPIDLGVAGGGGLRSLDRVRQPGQPAARARGDAAAASLPCAPRSAPAADDCCASS